MTDLLTLQKSMIDLVINPILNWLKKWKFCLRKSSHLTTNLATSVALWTAMLFGVISVSNKIATWNYEKHTNQSNCVYDSKTRTYKNT